MRVIIGCEFSGIVRDAFSLRGHDAYSCDLLPTESELTKKEGKHFQEDLLEVLKREKFDLGIFHPPCTYLCNAGVQYLHKQFERRAKMWNAVWFFNQLYRADINYKIPKIAIENPVPHRYAELPAYTQIVYPYQFGEQKSKRTCLWLKNLSLLKPTNIVNKGEFYKCGNGGTNPKWYSTSSKNRSKTFQGIAEAMADQWS